MSPRHLLCLLLAFAALVPAASAQITITEADLRSVHESSWLGTTREAQLTPASRVALQSLLTQTGASQAWDFRTVPLSSVSQYAVSPAVGPTPGAADPHLAQATVVVRIDSVGSDEPLWTYHRLAADGMTTYGTALLDDDGVLLTIKNVPGLTQPLPYTYGSTWTSSSEVIFAPEPIPGTVTMERTSSVVGWGTLVLPDASEPALMVRTEVVSRYEMPGLPPWSTTTVHVAFETRGGATATILLGQGGDIQSATYTMRSGATADDPAAADASLTIDAVTPNPSAGPVRVGFTVGDSGPVRLALYDRLGREIGMLLDGDLTAGTHHATVDTAALPAGVYVVRLVAGDQTRAAWMTIAR